MTEQTQIAAETRRDVGKGAARQLRRAGYIPAVVYGAGKEPVKLKVQDAVLDRVLRRGDGGQTVLDLVIDTGSGEDHRPVIIRELQQDVVSLRKLHVDFLEVRLDVEITDSVPLEVIGEPPGLSQGALLEVLRREIKVSALPHQLPQSIQVDASGLEIGQAVRVSEVTPPEGVRIIFEDDFPLVILNMPRRAKLSEAEEEAEAAAEAAAEAEGEEGEAPEGAEAAPARDKPGEE